MSFFPGTPEMESQSCPETVLAGVSGLWDFKEGRVGSLGIRLGRRFSRSSTNLHQNKPPTWLVHIPGHPWVLGQATGISEHKTHHGPDSGEATTFPHIVYSAMFHGGYIQMALFPGNPKLESRNCLETIPGGVLGLWELITPIARSNCNEV
jgi:hypothetical protein